MEHRIINRKISYRMLAGLLLVPLVFLAGCYYDNEEELYTYYYTANPCDTTNITFNGTIFPIIQGNCSTTGCHVAGGTGIGLFENYDQVKAYVDNGKLENRTLVVQNMPPSSPLTACQQTLLQRWIDAGAPNN